MILILIWSDHILIPDTTYNNFKILTEDEEEDHETRIIDDSIVREKLQEFCRRSRSIRRRMCMPDGHLNDISAACDEATSTIDNNTI